MWSAKLAASMLLLGGVSACSSAKRQIKATPVNAPFALQVDQVRAVPLTGYAAAQGYDHAFELLLKARGTQPSWWGEPIESSSGFNLRDPTTKSRIVTIEKNGARLLKAPSMFMTTRWNKDLKRYTARLEVNGSKFPRDMEVRWQGRIAVAEFGHPPLSETIRYDVLLKKAGEIWKTPPFSRDPEMTIRKVALGVAQPVVLDEPQPSSAKIRIPSQLQARITAFSAGGRFQSLNFEKFVDAQGRDFNLKLDETQTLRVPMFGVMPFFAELGKGGVTRSHIGQGRVEWELAQLLQSPRDVSVVLRATAQDRWPLEFRFPIKRNGKILKGEVPVTMRPAPMGRD